MTARNREFLLGALAEGWAVIEDLVHDLTPSQWLALTPCPAWDVRDQIAHIVAAEYALTGQFGTPGITPDSELYAAAGMFMVDVREESPRELLDRFREITAERLAALADLTDAAWSAPTWTPNGPGTTERLIRMRVFDCWMHEQDIRDALDRPGHERGGPVTVTLDLIGDALGPVLARQAGAPDGSIVTIEATGAAPRTWHVVVEGGRARPVQLPPRTPDVSLQLATGLFTRLCGGRVDPESAIAAVRINGDVELGRRIVANLRFTN